MKPRFQRRFNFTKCIRAENIPRLKGFSFPADRDHNKSATGYLPLEVMNMYSGIQHGIAMLLLAAGALGGCHREEPGPLPVPVFLSIEHTVGGALMEMDTIGYENAAGNKLSVTRMLYYLSGLTFIDEEGNRHTMAGAHLVDASDESTWRYHTGDLPAGKYLGMELNIGLVPELNTFGALPNTIENNAMFWPEQMGGGYHFLKLEGHFIDSKSQNAGYAMHLGTNETLTHIILAQDFRTGLENIHLTLRMDVMEWFRVPHNYDLNDGNYSMGDPALMDMISKNGRDVFTLVP